MCGGARRLGGGRGVVPAPGWGAAPVFPGGGPVRLALLGATGSIGRQTVDVARRHADRVQLVSVAAGSSAAELAALCREFPSIRTAALSDVSADDPVLADFPAACEVLLGKRHVDQIPARVECDVVLNALSGFAGMRASVCAVESGRVLALANKESLVAGGDLIMPRVRPGSLLPVDSEHSAIFQCMAGEDPWDASRIWITASGGPFFGMSRERLLTVTPGDALRHPNWNMGRRITVDSASLMNKGLEVIEAHHLFDFPVDGITALVQRQSLVHSMVEFSDGSVKAHLGAPDMRVPIQLALSYPGRWDAPVPPVDWTALSGLELGAPDMEAFPCLGIALQAGRRGGVGPCAMNAADEVAVAAFLSGRVGFMDIPQVIARVLEEIDPQPVESVEQLEQVDEEARRRAEEAVCAVSR